MEKELGADSDLLMPSIFGWLQQGIFKIFYKKNTRKIPILICKLTEVLIDYIAKLQSVQSRDFL